MQRQKQPKNPSRYWSAEDPDHINKCGKKLKNGYLVAFPTETVYGLGADALNTNAILNIFLTKKRPLTDPLIVHVSKIENASRFHDLNQVEKDLFKALADKFMPGPLTVVGKARKDIPKELCANTGFVGVRFPKHPVALKLIEASGTSIAAPSANLFGHVSPTMAEHVMYDFEHCGIDILNGGSTAFGIESSVIKFVTDLESEVIYIEVLRLGSISLKMLEDFALEYNKSLSSKNSSLEVYVVKATQIKEESENLEGPGQFLKHYSPNKNCYILRSLQHGKYSESSFENSLDLKKGIVLDFGGSHKYLEEFVSNYKDLSPNGDVREAMKNYYASLRELEVIVNCDYILIADLEQQDRLFVKENGDFVESLYDKIFRSCEGLLAICSGDKKDPKIARVK